MNPQSLGGGGYPDLSGPTTKKTFFFTCVFPYNFRIIWGIYTWYSELWSPIRLFTYIFRLQPYPFWKVECFVLISHLQLMGPGYLYLTYLTRIPIYKIIHTRT